MNRDSPMCMSCNVSGCNFMFAVHCKGMMPIHVIMAPECIDVLALCQERVC